MSAPFVTIFTIRASPMLGIMLSANTSQTPLFTTVNFVETAYLLKLLCTSINIKLTDQCNQILVNQLFYQAMYSKTQVNSYNMLERTQLTISSTALFVTNILTRQHTAQETMWSLITFPTCSLINVTSVIKHFPPRATFQCIDQENIGPTGSEIFLL